MTRFRPCIDLHAGQVKQIVGGTLTTTWSDLKTNHVSKQPASHFAQLYKDNALAGAHIIMLGPGNEEAAKQALAAWPHSLQVGGGITDKNARQWIDWSADKIIITSYLFPDARFSMARLQAVLHALGDDKSKLVIDLSCRRKGTSWFVAMNKWQTLTNMEINQGAPSPAHARYAFDDTDLHAESIDLLQPWCSEFLIHAADNEGLQRGIDEELVQKLAAWCLVPVTYAGGAHSLEDLDRVKALSAGKVDLTIGSALDIFGGDGVKFLDCVKWDREQEAEGPFRNQI